ncbi:toxin [Fulvimarina endophytica]|uniref:toxin n=1 Tax=Fulvimarina endophytica TaxID=2293836 RepID=UPI0018F42BD9|nr:toxin [Fulvimarina endophytica]
MPLVNADRMMVSILPEANSEGILPSWAVHLRDTDESWMRVAQKGVQAFVGHAMNAKVPFAMETVFSHWVEREDGTFESKIDLIRDMQEAGYFVLLIFVGLASVELSVSRVATRVLLHGHGVAEPKLRERFARTQKAVAAALKVADASLLTDNSRDQRQAFTVCRVEIAGSRTFDIRLGEGPAPPKVITRWLDVVAVTP